MSLFISQWNILSWCRPQIHGATTGSVLGRMEICKNSGISSSATKCSSAWTSCVTVKHVPAVLLGNNVFLSCNDDFNAINHLFLLFDRVCVTALCVMHLMNCSSHGEEPGRPLSRSGIRETLSLSLP